MSWAAVPDATVVQARRCFENATTTNFGPEKSAFKALICVIIWMKKLAVQNSREV
jgi:hypothetical protein